MSIDSKYPSPKTRHIHILNFAFQKQHKLIFEYYSYNGI